MIDAAPGLMLGGALARPLGLSVIWMVVIQAVFAPLAIARHTGAASDGHGVFPVIPARRRS